MIVEITGTHFQNKGAELMLAAIAAELLSRGHIPSIIPWSGSYNQRARYGLHQIMWYQRYGIPWSKFPTPFPLRLRRQYGLIKPDEIDLILDASGFKYSDQWGEKSILESLAKYKVSTRRGASLILLPQAFGLFENKRVMKATEEIIDLAKLVYARDKISFEYISELNIDKSKIKIRPDFTSLLKGSTPEIPLLQKKDALVCIVPNYRMIDKYFAGEQMPYINFMVKSIKSVIDHNLSPFLLIHERGTDNELAEKIVQEAKLEIPILYTDNPLEIKGIIAACRLFIGSRFHGLVSALSQGIPALGTGWSHKYQMLFEDYGCPEYLIDLEKDDIQLKLDRILYDVGLSSKLIATAQGLKEEITEMWAEIFRLTE